MVTFYPNISVSYQRMWSAHEHFAFGKLAYCTNTNKHIFNNIHIHIHTSPCAKNEKLSKFNIKPSDINIMRWHINEKTRTRNSNNFGIFVLLVDPLSGCHSDSNSIMCYILVEIDAKSFKHHILQSLGQTSHPQQDEMCACANEYLLFECVTINNAVYSVYQIKSNRQHFSIRHSPTIPISVHFILLRSYLVQTIITFANRIECCQSILKTFDGMKIVEYATAKKK